MHDLKAKWVQNSTHLFAPAISLAYLQIEIEKLQVQTQIMHQNLAVILQLLCNGKISFVVLVPDAIMLMFKFAIFC